MFDDSDDGLEEQGTWEPDAYFLSRRIFRLSLAASFFSLVAFLDEPRKLLLVVLGVALALVVVSLIAVYFTAPVDGKRRVKPGRSAGAGRRRR